MGSPPKPQRAWDFKSRYQNVAKIERALLDPTETNFTDIPLTDALDYLQEVHQIPIWKDIKALSDEGVSFDNTVNLVVSGVSLRSALSLMLEPLLLDYIIENEMMVITTRTKADTTFETRVYNASRLPNIKPKELVEIITTLIEPDRWMPRATETALPNTAPASAPSGVQGVLKDGVGATPVAGGGLALGNARASGNTLVIRQTQRIHKEVVELLNQLEQQATESPDLAPAERAGSNRGGGGSPLRDDVRRDSNATGGSSSSAPSEPRQPKSIPR